jgi:hypothetical protein
MRLLFRYIDEEVWQTHYSPLTNEPTSLPHSEFDGQQASTLLKQAEVFENRP